MYSRIVLRSPHPLLTSLSAIAMFCGCGNSGDNKQSANETQTSTEPGQGLSTAGDNKAIDAAFLPIDTLSELQGISLSSNAPCTLTLESLRPLFSSTKDAVLLLTKADNLKSVGSILIDLSTDLTAQSTSILPRTESDELRRTSAELSATMRDLAETLKLASEAAQKNDKQGANTTMRRLHNGVANIRVAIEGLANQCAN